MAQNGNGNNNPNNLNNLQQNAQHHDGNNGGNPFHHLYNLLAQAPLHQLNPDLFLHQEQNQPQQNPQVLNAALLAQLPQNQQLDGNDLSDVESSEPEDEQQQAQQQQNQGGNNFAQRFKERGTGAQLTR